MNREQKRKLKKHLQNISKERKKKERPTFVDRTDLSLKEGTKVKLNYQRIISRSDYLMLREDYRNFIEENKDKIFTIEYDPKYQYEPLWVCLEEDKTPVKRLFYIGDLLSV